MSPGVQGFRFGADCGIALSLVFSRQFVDRGLGNTGKALDFQIVGGTNRDLRERSKISF